MKSEVTLIFEETDGSLKWLFDVFAYAYHISEPNVQKMLEPMLKEFMHEKSYSQLMKLSASGISEEELVKKHIHKNLVRFSSPTVYVRGKKIKAMCYMIEQIGAMKAMAAGEDVPDYAANLLEGHENILDRMKDAITEALVTAGAKGVHIEKISSE
ncbi:hypothetical protein [Botryobacter ruber]|uniref:hypothetical protein n=1 Tax=Botryobacter ruber TaxID=2171629 RepID=UPI000E0AF397|nr:hypothetical protein [Botryobacter ruber]